MLVKLKLQTGKNISENLTVKVRQTNIKIYFNPGLDCPVHTNSDTFENASLT